MCLSIRGPAIRRSRSAASRAFAHGGSRLFQFDRTGKFVREIGQGSYGFLFAQQVRVDPQDNIWVVDQMSSMVIKFDPNGQVQMLLGRKAEAENVPALARSSAGRGRASRRARAAALAAGGPRRGSRRSRGPRSWCGSCG